MNLTLDTDVVVFGLIEPEICRHIYKEKYPEFVSLHKKAEQIFKSIVNGKNNLIIPVSVLIEISAVVSRITNDKDDGITASDFTRKYSQIIYLDPAFSDYCIENSANTKISGFDAVVLSTGMLYDSTLITNDRKFYNNITHYGEVDSYLLSTMNEDEVNTISK